MVPETANNSNDSQHNFEISQSDDNFNDTIDGNLYHPDIVSPFGDDGNNPDEDDGPPNFTEIQRDFAVDLEAQNLGNIPDLNVYQHKKTLAQGMMDLALFSANANQLRYVLESSRKHPYYHSSVILISISLIFQVAVGIGLILNATYNVKCDKQIRMANKINNFTIIGIFLVTVVNVFISAFGVAGPLPGS